MLWRVWIWTFDLHKAFGTDPLVATSGLVAKCRVVDEADGAFEGIFVQEDLNPLAIDVGILRELYLGGDDDLARILRRCCQGSQGLCSPSEDAWIRIGSGEVRA